MPFKYSPGASIEAPFGGRQFTVVRQVSAGATEDNHVVEVDCYVLKSTEDGSEAAVNAALVDTKYKTI